MYRFSSPLPSLPLVVSTLERISPLNAFVSQLPVPAGQPTFPSSSALSGVPVAIKDNFALKGFPVTCASKMLRKGNFIAPYDATIVTQLRSMGCVPIGKTNLDEYGMGSGGIDSASGPTKSLWRSGIPYNIVDFEGNILEGHKTDALTNDLSTDWVVAGGSSSGSAVAVSSGACLVGVGSDTGGSVRIPAAWNGLVSLKPGYGAVSRHGLIPLVNSLDVPGFMTRRVGDMQALWQELRMLKPCTMDSTMDQVYFTAPEHTPTPLQNLTIGIPQEYHCQDMSTETLTAWSDVATALESLGCTVKPVSLPHTKYALSCYSVLNPCEVASNMARYDGIEYGLRSDNNISTEAMFASSRHHGFNDVVRGRILAGNYFLLKENYGKFFEQALKIRRLIADDFTKAFQGVDLMLTPVALDVAPLFSEYSKADNRTQTTKQDYCTQPVNLAGLPAGTVPVRLSQKESLPVGVQFIGQMRSEAMILDVMKAVEDKFQCPQIELKQ